MEDLLPSFEFENMNPYIMYKVRLRDDWMAN